ncbi:MAG TPA: GNAT family protein [Patescibacteria group bacterium]|nr:GNAT family protein [Patescibacteria group bacterium]
MTNNFSETSDDVQVIRLGDERTLLLRPALPQDAASFLAYIEQVSGETDFLTFGPGEFNGTVEEQHHTYAFARLSTNELFLMAWIDNILIGNLSFRTLQRPRTAHSGEFGITVLQKYWNLGVGRHMIEYLIHWARAGGVVRKINLRVREDNIKGQQLYRRLGFTEEGRLRRDFFHNNRFYDSLCMGLLIDP